MKQSNADNRTDDEGLSSTQTVGAIGIRRVGLEGLIHLPDMCTALSISIPIISIQPGPTHTQQCMSQCGARGYLPICRQLEDVHLHSFRLNPLELVSVSPWPPNQRPQDTDYMLEPIPFRFWWTRRFTCVLSVMFTVVVRSNRHFTYREVVATQI